MTSQRTGTESRWDDLVREMNRLRTAAGSPSFAQLAAAIAERRVADGMSPDAARVPRSTLHGAFQYGRSRLNMSLVREIVAALGGDDAQVDVWLARVAGVSEPVPVTESNTDDEIPHPPERGTPVPPRAASPVEVPPGRPVPRSWPWVVALGCVAINLVGRLLVDGLKLPVYLDMVGTAIAALALGPWAGAGVGAATNVLGVVSSGWFSLAFLPVNVCGALVWGYGVRRFGLGRSVPRFFGLCLAVALACSLLAVPILVLFFGGAVSGYEISFSTTLRGMGDQLLLAVSITNLIASTCDKLISGFAAMVALSAMPSRVRRASGVTVLPEVGPR